MHVVHKLDKSQRDGFCGTSDWRGGWQRALKYRRHHKRTTPYAKQRFLQLFVAADKSFVDFHKRSGDAERYILTIMNMVSDLYHDASIGHAINIVVVRIVQLESDDEFAMGDPQNASETLVNFCRWQQQQNPQDLQHPLHHDAAILLTRRDLCIDGGCGLLGLARVASVCVPKSSCAINEDNGLTLGVTVSHEIGHLMGCDHDDANANRCAGSIDESSNHVMAPTVKLSTIKWSSCSAEYIEDLFEQRLGDCLSDVPRESTYKLDGTLPGTIYDGDYQCRLAFGESSATCKIPTDKFCQKLWCQSNDTSRCLSNTQAAADGTSCGPDKWCIKRECLPIGKLPVDAVPGGWSDWSEWTKCNRECGGGVQQSQRQCDNPVPKNGGRYCFGESLRHQICNTKECPISEPSFRSVQCSRHDSNGIKQQPFIDEKQSCALFCQSKSGRRREFSPQAENGTPCKAGTNNLCISGQCKVSEFGRSAPLGN